MKRLPQLLRNVRAELLSGSLDVPVRSIVTDSRSAREGDAFVCLPGYRTEGGETRADRHDFAAAAAANGARVFVVQRPVAVPDDATVVRVDDCWNTVSRMACELYDHPSQALTVIGVTGTSGKTSTTYYVESVLRAAGIRTACLGTIEYRFGDHVLPAIQTTPEAPQLQQLLRTAVDRGMQAVVMEVSSHALELRRVGGVAFDVAVFTNISQDHLNFHPDMHHYLRAKGRLFEELGSGGKRGTAVVNIDDPNSAHIIAVNRGSLLTYGTAPQAQVRAADIHSDLAGSRFTVRLPADRAIAAELRHLGDYQVYNALAAFSAGCALGIEADVIAAGVAAAPPIPGRFELVDCGQDFRVAVDYAHKPDALERLLRSGRSLQPRRLITVVGCGGDRDRQKRPLMGRIAAEQSDVAIITSDNPRTEEPLAIIDEIVAGVRQAAGTARLSVEPDRARAIAMAIGLAGAGDLVLIAGKGHETYQILGTRRVHFDDREQARAALRAARRR
jgi:UDP-N-acetylmuramoyl-L-alanyl-D-glutamate--2,6-diaminopimelate ligase